MGKRKLVVNFPPINESQGVLRNEKKLFESLFYLLQKLFSNRSKGLILIPNEI